MTDMECDGIGDELQSPVDLRREIDRIVGDLEKARMRMVRLRFALSCPGSDQDVSNDSDFVGRALAAVECLLMDRLDPALDDLGRLLGLAETEELEPEEQPGPLWC